MGGECGIKMEANSYQNETNEDASHGKVSQASPIDSRDPEPSLDPAWQILKKNKKVVTIRWTRTGETFLKTQMNERRTRRMQDWRLEWLDPELQL